MECLWPEQQAPQTILFLQMLKGDGILDGDKLLPQHLCKLCLLQSLQIEETIFAHCILIPSKNTHNIIEMSTDLTKEKYRGA